jgi:hypothetical protein
MTPWSEPTAALPPPDGWPERGLPMPAPPLPAAASTAAAAPAADWDSLLPALDEVLRSLRPDTTWLPRLLRLRDTALQWADRAPDAALLHLVYSAGLDSRHYSSRHALLCLVVARATARQLHWPASPTASLGLAALTMNAAIGGLQDALAGQRAPLSPAQRQAVADHAAHTAQALADAGVADPAWIEIVRLHHDDQLASRPLHTLAAEQQAARLLQRVDVFTAALSCRDSRPALSPARAARAACCGADGLPDELGTALLQAVGVYPPGSAVRLASGETALVLGRGPRANLPVLALLTRPDGAPLARPQRCDGHTLARAVSQGLALADLQLLPALATLTTLAALSA